MQRESEAVADVTTALVWWLNAEYLCVSVMNS